MCQETINYIEWPAADLRAIKAFYSQVFDWQFTDYGEEYTAFKEASLEGGFFKSAQASSSANGAALVVLYSPALEESEQKIVAAGGAIIKPIFAFPGGRRFHFTDPCGNELAVWSDQ